MPQRLYSRDWPKVRLEILDRDGWLCQIKGPRCKTTATEADHIIPPSEGGSERDRRNLRAVCKPCHNSRKSRQLVVVRTGEGGQFRDW